jgi:MFS family permease
MVSGRPVAGQLRRFHLSVFAASIGVAYVYLIPAFAEQLGAGYLDLGWIGTVRSLPYTFLPVIAGYLGDRVGRRRLYVLSILFVGSATLLLAATHTIAGILAVQILLGIGLSLFWPVSEAFVSEISPVNDRTAAIGMYAVAWGIGFLIGPLLGGVVADAAGFQFSFLAAGILIVTTSGISAVAIRGEQERHGDSPQSSTRPSWKVVSAILPMLVVQIPYAIVLAFIVSIFPGYAAKSGLSPSEVGLLLSGFGFARAIAFSFAGRLERYGERKSVGLASLVMALVLFLMPTNRSFIALLADACFAGLLIGIIYPQTAAYVSKRSPIENLGFAMGAYEAIFGIGFAVGPILAGFIAETISLEFAFIVMAIVALSIIPMLAAAQRGP